MTEPTPDATPSAIPDDPRTRAAVPCYQRSQLARRLWGDRSPVDAGADALRAALTSAGRQVVE